MYARWRKGDFCVAIKGALVASNYFIPKGTHQQFQYLFWVLFRPDLRLAKLSMSKEGLTWIGQFLELLLTTGCLR